MVLCLIESINMFIPVSHITQRGRGHAMKRREENIVFGAKCWLYVPGLMGQRRRDFWQQTKKPVANSKELEPGSFVCCM
jgi:hypothetical protein